MQAGIILGNTVLGHILGDKHEKIFPDEDILLDILTKFGFMFFMFLVGVKMDPGMIRKAGRKGITVGICASVIPLVAGNAMANEDYLEYILPIYRRPAVRTIVKTLILTPFPVVATLLIDLKIMNSELGRLSLTAALISDIINAVVNTFWGTFRIFLSGFGMPISVVTLAQSLAVTLLAFSTRPMVLKIIKETPEGRPVRTGYIAIICAVVMLLSVASDNVGLTYHFGPFVAGLVMPAGPPIGSSLSEKMDTFITGLLAPLILTYCAIKIDLTQFYDFAFMRVATSYLVAITCVKFVSVFVLALINKVPIKDAVTLGIIMCAQGTVQGALYENNYRIQVTYKTTDDGICICEMNSLFPVIFSQNQ